MLDSNLPVLAPMVDKLSRHSQLGWAEVEALLALPCKVARIDPGTYLVREGDKADSCIVLLSGFVYRSKCSGRGTRQILSIHLRGDLVDLQNSLLDQADHSVQALTHVDVAYIPHQALLQASDAYPAVARALWRDTLVDASVSREWTMNVGQRLARERIAHLMCELALRQAAAGVSQGPEYKMPMTQEQIGEATGLTPVHVNRTMQGMRSDGLISYSKRNLTVPDWGRLEEAGDFNGALSTPAEFARSLASFRWR